MEIEVLFFGEVAEIVGENKLMFNSISYSDELTSILCEKYPKLKKINFQIARNNQLIKENTMLENKDVLAFLPPFTGG